jgi:hypothetical protein
MPIPDNLVPLYEPRTMLEGMRQTYAPLTFFKDTFFRQTVPHTTKTVEFDVYKGKRRAATYRAPYLPGRIVQREGWDTKTTRPAYFKEKTILTPEDTVNRSFGENIYQAQTPGQRAAAILGGDLAMLNERFLRAEEKMCAEALLTGKVHVVDAEGGWDAEMDFGYVPGENIKILTGTSAWNGTDPDILKDLDTWRGEIIERSGLQPTHCILSSDLAWIFIDDEKVKKRLDNTINQTLGFIKPEDLPAGIGYLGTFTLPRGPVRLMTYSETYTDPITGVDVPLMPPGTVLMGSDMARCAMHYGMIQNFNNNLGATPRFPWVWEEDDGSARFVQLESAPMPNIYQVDAFITASVLD